MAINTRGDVFGELHTGINTREIVKASRLVSRMSGLLVPRNKAIVGENAFAHSSGIHQDGILKKRETYEIMDPEEVGWGVKELPLTKHSGRHAVAARLKHLGFKMSDADVESIFERFKEIGDKKKFVYDDDLTALVEGVITEVPETWSLEYLNVTCGNQTVPTATVRLRRVAGRKGRAAGGEVRGAELFQVGGDPEGRHGRAQLRRISTLHGRGPRQPVPEGYRARPG